MSQPVTLAAVGCQHTFRAFLGDLRQWLPLLDGISHHGDELPGLAFVGVLLGIIAVQVTMRVSGVSYLYYNLVGAAVSVVVGYLVSLLFSER